MLHRLMRCSKQKGMQHGKITIHGVGPTDSNYIMHKGTLFFDNDRWCAFCHVFKRFKIVSTLVNFLTFFILSPTFYPLYT